MSGYLRQYLRQFGLVIMLASLALLPAHAREKDALNTVMLANLPMEAQATYKLIQAGGPFPYAKDGVVFGNYEGALPKQKRGYYHEYTVKTPNARNRGARRIITGGTPPTAYYYTEDHYQSFTQIQP